MTLVSGYAGIVCDLDGVVYRGPTAVEHAVAALEATRVPVVYATNNASRVPGEVAEHLRTLGLTCAPGDVVNSSQAAAQVLTTLVPAGSRVLAVGGDGVRTALVDAGYAVVAGAEDGPVAVVQGYGPQVTAADLAEAAYAIAAGAVWVATNSDRTLPTERGTAPGNGALVGAVAAAVAREPDAVAGKPHPPLYLLAAERLGVPAERLLALGDRLETDIEGANRTGMESVLVLTGVHDVHDVASATSERRPTWVVPDLRWLHRPLPRPEWDGTTAHCGAASARPGSHGMETQGDGVELLNAILLAMARTGLEDSGDCRALLDAVVAACR